MPVINPDQPPDQWELSTEGHLAAAALAPFLPSGAYVSASNEPKAWQTVTPIGRPHLDARFGEVGRTPDLHLRPSYVEGADHSGWEPRAQVAARFDAGIEEHLARAGTAPLVVASHGMAMTVWLTARIGLASPGEFWAALRFPDLLRVDLERREVIRPML